MEPIAKPFLRWAGSKKKLLPELSTFYPQGSRYIEPFVGSGQLFFNLPIEQALLGDVNIQLIDTYEVIRDNPNEIYEQVISFSIGEQEYYRLRALDTSNETAIFKAARFLYLNTFCFNGLYRTNQSGQFNVPFSKSSGRLANLEELLLVSTYLKKAKFYNQDFESLIVDNCESGDFIYLDPPYAVKNKRIFHQYNAQTFGLNDLERLKELLTEIHRRGAKFVLSYAVCDEAIHLTGNWNHRIVSTQRNISGFAKHRRIEKEILITNLSL